MEVRAKYVIESEPLVSGGADPIVIRDIGAPHEDCPTVTNDAQAIVAALHAEGRLPTGQVLHYYDSEGVLTELRHDGEGKHLGYRHVKSAPPEAPSE